MDVTPCYLLLLCYGTRYTDQIVKVGTQQSTDCWIGTISFLCSDVEFCRFSVNFSFAACSFLSNKHCHIVVLNNLMLKWQHKKTGMFSERANKQQKRDCEYKAGDIKGLGTDTDDCLCVNARCSSRKKSYYLMGFRMRQDHCRVVSKSPFNSVYVGDLFKVLLQRSLQPLKTHLSCIELHFMWSATVSQSLPSLSSSDQFAVLLFCGKF